MPKHQAQSFEDTKDSIAMLFPGAAADAVAEDLGEFFKAEGYRLEKGDPASAVYGKGNEILRLLLGGLVKRFKFQTKVSQEGDAVAVVIQKGMSGMMGGLLGVSQMKKEIARLTQAARTHFGAQG